MESQTVLVTLDGRDSVTLRFSNEVRSGSIAGTDREMSSCERVKGLCSYVNSRLMLVTLAGDYYGGIQHYLTFTLIPGEQREVGGTTCYWPEI